MARKRRRNRRRRRGSFAFLYKVLAFLAICGAIIAALALFFRTGKLEISGNSRYTQEEIISASGVAEGDNLFLLNKYEVAERIRDQLPYVSAVRISRQLPDTLCIAVTESACAVGIEQEGKLWLVCDSGKIVDVTAPNEKAPYARVTGLTLLEPEVGQTISSNDQEQCAQLLELLSGLGKKGMLEQVQGIGLEDPSVITLRYMDAFDVELSRHSDFSYKLDYLTAVIEKLEDNEKGTIILTQDGEARFIPR